MGVQTTPPFTNTYSLDFDGVDDYVDLGDSDDFSFGNGTTDSPFSISAWIKMDDASAFRVATKYENANREYLFTTDSSDRLSLALYDNSNGTRIQRKYNTALTSFQGQWINVVGTYDGSSLSSGINIYLNGTRVDDIDGNLGTYIAMENTTQPLEIGRSNLTSFSNGKIDEVAIFNTALTPTEITSIASAPTDLTSLSPIAWYRMGDNGSYKSPQWLLPNNENKDKVSNYSLSFDAVDDYVNCGVISNFVSSSAFSICGWFYFDSVVNETLFSYGGSVGTQYCFTVQTFSGGNLIFVIANATNDAGNNYIQTNLSSVLNTSTWYHIACTYDGSQAGNTDKAKIYVNGTEATYGSGGGTIPNTTSASTGSFNIGRWDLGASDNRLLNGKIDEVAIFNEVVDIADVWDGSGEPIDVSSVSGIVSNYRMGEEASFSGGVWTVPDAIGSNDGTSNAMTIEDRVGDAPNSENNALSYNMDLVDRTTDVPT
jgi:hypothetical protein